MPRFGDDYAEYGCPDPDDVDLGDNGELDRSMRIADAIHRREDEARELSQRPPQGHGERSTRPNSKEESMTASPQTAPPVVPSRMAIGNVVSGKQQRPHRAVLYGPEGIGKSTFGLGAPKAIFIDVEGGTGHLDAKRFPKPETWKDVRAGVRELITAKHEYQTLVIDTLDAAEALLWRHMIERDVYADPGKQKNRLRDIEDYGYGKGFQKALEDWRGLLRDLELLQSQRLMNVILVAHAHVKPFKNPVGDDFDRYELKMNAKAAGLIKEWADSVLFTNYETFAAKDKDRPQRVRGVDTGARLIFTERRAAYDAKHRGNLPASLPLSWADFAAEAEKEIDPKQFAEAILKLAAELPEDKQKLVAESITKAAGNITSLTSINNRVNARLAEMATEKEEN